MFGGLRECQLARIFFAVCTALGLNVNQWQPFNTLQSEFSRREVRPHAVKAGLDLIYKRNLKGP